MHRQKRSVEKLSLIRDFFSMIFLHKFVYEVRTVSNIIFGNGEGRGIIIVWSELIPDPADIHILHGLSDQVQEALSFTMHFV